MDKCAKCKSEANGSIYIEGGESYPFCKNCTDILETFPAPTNIMHIFLTPEQKMNQVDKNIFAARKRRLSGAKIWKSKDKWLINKIDLSPITLNKIECDERILILESPLVLLPNMEAEELYVAENDFLNINVFAHSSKELIDALNEQIFFLWVTYAADDVVLEDLTDGALLLRIALRKRFREGT